MPRRVSKKTTKPRRKIYRKRRYNRKSRALNVPEYASLSCKRTLAPTGGGNFVVNNLYNLMNTQLINYDRAVQVAQAYQHYRIKKITMTFKPTYDTFANGNQSKTHLYFMLDKSGSIPLNVSLEGLKEMGARPFALDEKERKISWTPTVLEASMYASPPAVPVAVATPAKYQVSPWLSTNASITSAGAFVPSGIDHLGIYWYCEQLVTPTATQYEIEVEVQFQFKKPLSLLVQNSQNAIPAVTATINDSKDGVVGGGDGV